MEWGKLVGRHVRIYLCNGAFLTGRIVEAKGQLLLVDSPSGVLKRFLVPKQSVAMIEVLPEVRK